MKWAVIGHNILAKRFQALDGLLKSKSVASDLTLVEATTFDFSEKLPALLQSYDQLRIESPFGEMVMPLFKKHGMMMTSIHAADCVHKRSGEWWPESALYHAFNLLFSRHGNGLHLDAEVLVVGAGSAARTAAASLVRAGFKRINITNKFDDQGLVLTAELKRTYFACNFEFITQDRLVLLPGSNILVINTTPLIDSNDLLEELYYLNFMRRDGMIWDLTLSVEDTPLMKEAKQIDVRCVGGIEVASMVDEKWVEWVTGKSISSAELREAYRAALCTKV